MAPSPSPHSYDLYLPSSNLSCSGFCQIPGPDPRPTCPKLEMTSFATKAPGAHSPLTSHPSPPCRCTQEPLSLSASPPPISQKPSLPGLAPHTSRSTPSLRADVVCSGPCWGFLLHFSPSFSSSRLVLSPFLALLSILATEQDPAPNSRGWGGSGCSSGCLTLLGLLGWSTISSCPKQGISQRSLANDVLIFLFLWVSPRPAFGCPSSRGPGSSTGASHYASNSLVPNQARTPPPTSSSHVCLNFHCPLRLECPLPLQAQGPRTAPPWTPDSASSPASGPPALAPPNTTELSAMLHPPAQHPPVFPTNHLIAQLPEPGLKPLHLFTTRSRHCSGRQQPLL